VSAKEGERDGGRGGDEEERRDKDGNKAHDTETKKGSDLDKETQKGWGGGGVPGREPQNKPARS